MPTQNLDVRGTAKVVGLVTASDLFVSGVSTFTEIQVGSAITIVIVELYLLHHIGVMVQLYLIYHITVD